MRTVLKGFNSATEALVRIGYVALAGTILLVSVDVFGRYLLNRPVRGSIEIVEQTMAIVGGCAIMYATVKRGHVAINILSARFSRRTQIIMQVIFSLLGFAAWAVLAYRIYMDSLQVLKFSQSTIVLGINMAPFLLALALCAFLSSLMYFIHAFHPVVSDETMGEKE